MKRIDPEECLIKSYNILKKKSSSKSRKLDALEYYRELLNYLNNNDLDSEQVHLIKNSSIVYNGLIKDMCLNGNYFKGLKEEIDISFNKVREKNSK